MALSNRKIMLFFLVLFVEGQLFSVDMTSVSSNPMGLRAEQFIPAQPQRTLEPNVSLDVNPSPVVTAKTLSQPIMQQVPHPHITPLLPGQSGDSDIYLNFENTSLGSVMNYLAEQKKINILPHKDLDSCKVSLATRKPLSLERAWNVLLTLLEMNGFSIIKVDNLFRVVSNKDSGAQPLPIYSSKTGTEPENLPDSDLVIRYIYFFQNIKPEMAQDILSKLLEGEGAVQPNPDLQAVILKEKCFNIKAAMKIVKELDTGGLRESIKIIRLNHANVQDVKDLFDKILEGDKQKSFRFPVGQHKETFYFSSSTKIIPNPLKNSLVLLGTEKNLERLTDFIYKYVDVPIGAAESRVHIKEIRYAKSEDIAAIAQAILKPPAGQQTGKGILVGKYKFFEDTTVVAEAAAEGFRGSGNRLLVACNEDDWIRLNDFIDKLDKPEPQVAFEVLVVIISETQDKELGAQLQSKDGKQLGMGINRLQFYNDFAPLTDSADKKESTKDPTALPMEKYIKHVAGDTDGHASYMTIGRSDTPENMDIWALIRSVVTKTNSHIISQPYVVANNHKECSVEIGQDRLVSGPLKPVDNGSRSIPTKVSARASTLVKLIPHINSDGVVVLEITVTINEFASEGDAPTVLNRTIETQASLLAGQVLVLGGMKKSNQGAGVYKTPILGDIPILGNLFKYKYKEKTDEHLYVFIRPSIIKPRFEGAPDEYTQLKLDYAKYQMIKNDEYVQDKDPIQRWFFKPENYGVKHKLEDVGKGVVPAIDDFALGKDRPKMVNIKEDSYYRSSETIKKSKETLKRRKKSDA